LSIDNVHISPEVLVRSPVVQSPAVQSLVIQSPVCTLLDSAPPCPDVLNCASQTDTVSVQNRSRKVQCGVRSKAKSVQTKLSRTSDSYVQVSPDVMEYSVQTCVATDNFTSQVGSGLHQLVDVASQVGPDPVVAVEDKASGVTLDLVNSSQKHSQTQFLCPGHEDDPSYDPFWLNRYCRNADCRYAALWARQCRGPMYTCTLCNIVMCHSCKLETVHDEMCEESLSNIC
jgi:hypothetical protein